MSKIIGIDLGTTNSVAAILINGEPQVIPSAEGERLIPSVVAVTPKGERIVGRAARNQAIINPENTIFSIKRFMGRKLNDPQVEQARQRMPYRVLGAPNGDVRVMLGGREYTPQEISAMILAKIKADVEAYLGEAVTQAVITVPAYFDDAQRNATRDAGRIAGLEVVRIINEPTASALAYGLDRKKDEIIAVYDLGGGTFDVSILQVTDGVFQVLATSGDTFLGGDDFDRRIMEHLIEEFQKETGIDLSQDRQALQRLKEAAEKAKIELSTLQQTEIHLPYLAADARGPKHLVRTFTRARLEQLTADLIEHTLEPVRQALSDAGLKAEDVDEVVLVGGMTRMPAIQERVRRFFGKLPHKGINPDEVVAIGAAIQAAILQGEMHDLLLLDVTPLTLSIETVGGVATPIIDRNTTIPTRRTQIFSTATDNQTQVVIHVVQGERPMAADNKSLGVFILDGIPPAPRGVPQIEVTFEIDANGILKVTAQDKTTGRSQHITISAASGLTQEEIERMRREAEAYAEEDRRRKEWVEACNRAENLLYTAGKNLRQREENLPTEIRERIEHSMNEINQAIQREDIQALKLAIRSLEHELQAISIKENTSTQDTPRHTVDDSETQILDGRL